MKQTSKISVNKGGGYRGPRDEETGMTQGQLFSMRKRQDLEFDMAVKKGEYYKKSDIDAGKNDEARVIQSDLFGVLLSKLSTELSGKKLTPEQVWHISFNILHEIVVGWIDAKIVLKESIPNEAPRP